MIRLARALCVASSVLLALALASPVKAEDMFAPHLRPDSMGKPISPWCDRVNAIPRIATAYPNAIACESDGKTCYIVYKELPAEITKQIKECSELHEEES